MKVPGGSLVLNKSLCCGSSARLGGELLLLVNAEFTIYQVGP